MPFAPSSLNMRTCRRQVNSLAHMPCELSESIGVWECVSAARGPEHVSGTKHLSESFPSLRLLRWDPSLGHK